MSVSLKKPEKVDLSKPECPPKMREYTPVHLINEEETIVKRPRQPPVQPQHIEDNSIEFNSICEDLDIEKENKKTFWEKYKLPIMILLCSCLIVFAFLLIKPYFGEISLAFSEVMGCYGDFFSFCFSSPSVRLLFGLSALSLGIIIILKVYRSFTRWR